MNLPRHAVLLLIDVQTGFNDTPSGDRATIPAREQNMAKLLEAFRAAGRPVIFIQHVSQNAAIATARRPARESDQSDRGAQEANAFFRRRSTPRFINTPLERTLRGSAQDTLVICGITTDHCVSTTARMAGDMGFTAYVVDDACHCFDRTTHDGRVIPAQQVHEAALASLHDEFGTVTTHASGTGRNRPQ